MESVRISPARLRNRLNLFGKRVLKIEERLAKLTEIVEELATDLGDEIFFLEAQIKASKAPPKPRLVRTRREEYDKAHPRA